MPGLSTPQLRPGMGSASRKRNAGDKNQQRLLKTIRVIYLDPEVTDSSSDDEPAGMSEDKQVCGVLKRCVKEVCVFESSSDFKRNPAAGEKNAKLPSQNGMTQKGSRSKSKYVGVRKRESGRWGAEILDPIRGVRQWLGTHDTEEEAHAAYERKRLEFQALIKEKKGYVSAATQSNLRIVRSVAPASILEGIAASCPHKSPSSVLDVSNTTSHGGDTNASDNVNQPSDYNVKEAKGDKFDIEDDMKPDTQSQIQDLLSAAAFGDDFKIVLDELKPEDFLMCNLGDLAYLPNSSTLLDLDKEDFSWLNEVLKLCGFKD